MRKKRLGLALLSLILPLFVSAQEKYPEITRADSLRGMLSPFRACYDVNFYHLDIQVDVEEKQISGSNLFQFTAVHDFKILQFDLFDNYLIEKILYQGKELEYTTEFDAIFLEFPDTIKKGTKADFTVFYSGAPIIAKNAPWEGGFIYSQDATGKPWVAVACQELGASSWWPTKDHQSDEPDSMLISVSVPEGLMNISNGRLRSTEKLRNGYTRFNWFVSQPINNYNVTLNIGDFALLKDSFQGANGTLTLEYYILKENQTKAEKHFSANVKPMLQCFEAWFGPYPFYRDGYKLVETPYLGMEHQSAISYGNQYTNGYRGQDISQTGLGLKWDYIVIHESGHEWFGNNISSSDIADMWIHEAFTTYSEGVFVECTQGKDAARRYIAGLRKSIRNDIPIIGLYDVNKKGSTDMYFKGTNLLHTVRTLIDDDNRWRQILRGLNERFGLKTTTTEEIVTYINKLSGKDLTKVFDQYLRYRNIPQLEIKTTGSKILYRWKSDVIDFNMPIKAKLRKNGDWQFIHPTTDWQYAPTQLSAREFEVDTENFYIKVTHLEKE